MGCGASSEENEQPATSKLAERKRQKRLQNQNGNTSGEVSSADQSNSPNASNSAKYKKRESTHWAPVTAASPEAGKVSPSSDANKLAVPAASDPDESLGSSELFKALMKPGSPKAGAAVDVSTAENDEATPADSGAPGGDSQQDEGAWSPDGEPLIPTQ